MKEKAKAILILALGWGFIVLGILGLFLPVLQGILFLLLGLYLLSRKSPRAKRLYNRLRNKYPRLSRRAMEIRQKAAGFLAGLRNYRHAGRKKRRK
jgi:uncharacterized membrane protein YbaN (DUF454 family)